MQLVDFSGCFTVKYYGGLSFSGLLFLALIVNSKKQEL